jgi:hypothetical protein
MGHAIENQYGHDGTVIPDRDELEFLLRESAQDGERYGPSGARWPVVVATTGTSNGSQNRA